MDMCSFHRSSLTFIDPLDIVSIKQAPEQPPCEADRPTVSTTKSVYQGLEMGRYYPLHTQVGGCIALR